jgi:hypothetical protein
LLPTVTRRRVVAATIAVVAVAAIGILITVGGPLVSVGIAYSARMLCSEVFVAGRSPADVVADLAIDDLRMLRMIRTTVDTIDRTATAQFPLFATRRARYDHDTGCTLEPRSSSVAGLPASGMEHAATAIVDTAITRPNAAVQAVVDRAFDEPDPSLPRRTRAVVVMQLGAIIAERYAPGFGPSTPMPGWSMTKSVLNALIGIAVRDSVLDLHSPVRLGAWTAAGDPRAGLTVRDLLTMSSGLRFGEGQSDVRSDLLRMLFHAPDMAALAASRPLDAPPGTRWQYSSGTSLILSRILREALGDSAYRDFPRSRLFAPLGMTHATMETDPSGTFVASSYMYATAREWARFGQLYLQDGMWNGVRILPEGWVDFTRTPAPAAERLSYGAHFWLATPREFGGAAPRLPPGALQAIGHEGQFVTIIPSHDLVVVRLGRTRHSGSWDQDGFVVELLAELDGFARPGQVRR